MTANVVLSYARANADFALRLGGELRSAGVDLWVDQLDIPPGVPWDRAVQDDARGVLNRPCDSLTRGSLVAFGDG